MQLLVTGWAGFIYTVVVYRAISDGDAVINIDTLTYAARLDNEPWWCALHDRNGVGKRLGA